jgi:hypothetical protein
MVVPDAVIYKIIRAGEHLQALEADVAEYFKSHPAKIMRQEEGSPDEYIGRVIADTPIPMRLQLILGDFLQNLRSSLDYLVWELVLAAKNTPGEDNMFPICSTPDRFKGALGRRRLQGVPARAAAVIECLQPYNCGDFEKSLLWTLDNLCNINKHRRIPLTKLQGGVAPDGIESRVINGEEWTRVDLGQVTKNAKIGPFPLVQGERGPGVKVPMKLHIVAFIALDEGAAKGMHLSTVLAGMLSYVNDSVMPLFNEFFI